VIRGKQYIGIDVIRGKQYNGTGVIKGQSNILGLV